MQQITKDAYFFAQAWTQYEDNRSQKEQSAAVAALSPTEWNDIPDTLEVVVGMRCMITANMATTLGVANGSCGKIVGICLAKEDECVLQTSAVCWEL